MGAGKKANDQLKKHPVQINKPQKSEPWQPSPQCVDPPPFTLADVRRYLKEHSPETDFFASNMLTSLSYLARDIALTVVLGLLASKIDLAPVLLQPILWLVYWNLQGCVFVGMWILAHECGHRAFSSSQWVNNTVGHALHSFLLVPYHSWRITHSHHHSYTNCVEHDAVYIPAEYSSEEALMQAKENKGKGHDESHALHEAFQTSPIGALLMSIQIVVLGWPLYLMYNLWGPTKYQGKPNSHFDAASALFTKGEQAQVRESVLWFFGAVGLLCAAAVMVGPTAVLAYYVVPYLICNAYLISITLLQHTDTYVPHWHEGEFTFLRGALATVDRSWGWLRDELFHHISDSHVVHHMFSDMPFYHAVEATEILEGWEEFQKYRLKDYSCMELATVRSMYKCRCAPSGGDVCWYEDGRTSTIDLDVAKKLAEKGTAADAK